MLTIQGSKSVAANTTDDNVLSGKRNAQIDPSVPGAIVALYLTGSAAGLEAELWVGQRNPLEKSSVNTQNRLPVVPDDLAASNMPAVRNEIIRMPVTNTTGGALTINYRLDVEEVGAR